MAIDEGLIINWYKDANGDKISHYISGELQTVVTDRCVLSNVPDEFHRVTATHGITDLYEIDADATITSATQFKVDYIYGFVTFDSSLDAQVIRFNYYGKGQVYFPSSRIWVAQSNGNILSTLSDYLGATPTTSVNGALIVDGTIPYSKMVTGAAPIASGGTNAITFTANQLVRMNSAGTALESTNYVGTTPATPFSGALIQDNSMAYTKMIGLAPLSKGGTYVDGTTLTPNQLIRMNSAGTAFESTNYVGETPATPFSGTLIQDATIPYTKMSQTAPINKGGTNATSYTANQLIRMNAAGTGFESSGKTAADFTNLTANSVTAGSAAATANTTAINAALQAVGGTYQTGINDLCSGGEIVYLPTGDIYINSPIIIPRRCGLVGQTGTRLVAATTFTGTRMIELQAYNNTRGTTADQFLIQNLTLYGNRVNRGVAITSYSEAAVGQTDAGKIRINKVAHGLANGTEIRIPYIYPNAPPSCLNNYMTYRVVNKTDDYFNVSLEGTPLQSFYDYNISLANKTITLANHGLVDGTMIIMTTSGTLPAPITADTVYYVVGSTATTFQLALTSGGSAITFTDQGSGSMMFFTLSAISVISGNLGTGTTMKYFVKNLDAMYLDVNNAFPVYGLTAHTDHTIDNAGRINNVTIEDFSGHGINCPASTASAFFISNVYVYGCGQDGLHLRSTDNFVSNVSVCACKRGIYINGGNNMVINSKVFYNEKAGLFIDDSGTGNKISNFEIQEEMSINCYLHNCSTVQMDNIIMESNGHTGVAPLEGRTYDGIGLVLDNCKYCSIKGNVGNRPSLAGDCQYATKWLNDASNNCRCNKVDISLTDTSGVRGIPYLYNVLPPITNELIVNGIPRHAPNVLEKAKSLMPVHQIAGTPCIVDPLTNVFTTVAAHGYVDGDIVRFNAQYSMPAGLSANTDYTVSTTTVQNPTVYTFKVLSNSVEVDITNTLVAFATTDVTITPTNTITSAANALYNGRVVMFTTSGTLPAPLAVNTPYYVVNDATNSFKVAATSGGTAITITDVGTGSHNYYVVGGTLYVYKPIKTVTQANSTGTCPIGGWSHYLRTAYHTGISLSYDTTEKCAKFNITDSNNSSDTSYMYMDAPIKGGSIVSLAIEGKIIGTTLNDATMSFQAGIYEYQGDPNYADNTPYQGYISGGGTSGQAITESMWRKSIAILTTTVNTTWIRIRCDVKTTSASVSAKSLNAYIKSIELTIQNDEDNLNEKKVWQFHASPVSKFKPYYVGQEFFDYTNSIYYKATGNALTSQWVAIN